MVVRQEVAEPPCAPLVNLWCTPTGQRHCFCQQGNQENHCFKLNMYDLVGIIPCCFFLLLLLLFLFLCERLFFLWLWYVCF